MWAVCLTLQIIKISCYSIGLIALTRISPFMYSPLVSLIKSCSVAPQKKNIIVYRSAFKSICMRVLFHSMFNEKLLISVKQLVNCAHFL